MLLTVLIPSFLFFPFAGRLCGSRIKISGAVAHNISLLKYYIIPKQVEASFPLGMEIIAT